MSYSRQTLIRFGVSNLDRAIEFYTKVLGFTLTERRDDLQFAHIETNVPGLQIGLNPVPDAKGTGSAILNIGVTDIVAARRVLEGRGVVFRGETQIVPGKVSLAMFADPDGNALRLAGPAPRR